MNSTSGSVLALLLWRLGFSSQSSPFSVDLRFFVSLYHSKAFCLISSALLLSSFNVLDCVSVINFNKHVLKKASDKSSGGVFARGVLTIMAYKGRLRPNRVSFSGFRYMKGKGFYLLKYMKG